jgi:hypothetical protein
MELFRNSGTPVYLYDYLKFSEGNSQYIRVFGIQLLNIRTLLLSNVIVCSGNLSPSCYCRVSKVVQLDVSKIFSSYYNIEGPERVSLEKALLLP